MPVLDPGPRDRRDEQRGAEQELVVGRVGRRVVRDARTAAAAGSARRCGGTPRTACTGMEAAASAAAACRGRRLPRLAERPRLLRDRAPSPSGCGRTAGRRRTRSSARAARRRSRRRTRRCPRPPTRSPTARGSAAGACPSTGAPTTTSCRPSTAARAAAGRRSRRARSRTGARSGRSAREPLARRLRHELSRRRCGPRACSRARPPPGCTTSGGIVDCCGHEQRRLVHVAPHARDAGVDERPVMVAPPLARARVGEVRERAQPGPDDVAELVAVARGQKKPRSRPSR